MWVLHGNAIEILPNIMFLHNLLPNETILNPVFSFANKGSWVSNSINSYQSKLPLVEPIESNFLKKKAVCLTKEELKAKLDKTPINLLLYLFQRISVENIPKDSKNFDISIWEREKNLIFFPIYYIDSLNKANLALTISNAMNGSDSQNITQFTEKVFLSRQLDINYKRNFIVCKVDNLSEWEKYTCRNAFKMGLLSFYQ